MQPFDVEVTGPAPVSRGRRLLTVGVVVVALGLVAFGTRGLWERHEATTGSADPDAPLAAGELDETPVPLTECRAAPDEPKIITLGSLRVEGCIEPVGVTDGQLDSPDNIHVAGWYEKSPRPGDDGLSIIDGHSSGRFADGIFNEIDQFEAGSLFTVEYGDGSVRRFEVTSVESHAVADTMTRMRSDANAQDASLALITCGGDYDADDHSFDERVVVLAVNA